MLRQWASARIPQEFPAGVFAEYPDAVYIAARMRLQGDVGFDSLFLVARSSDRAGEPAGACGRNCVVSPFPFLL